MRVKNPLRTAARILFGRVPIESQLVVTRRCNLSCGYCSEFDDHSPEVPFEALRSRIAALHRLGAVNIALMGGEPLLHSRILDVVELANRSAQVSMTTNGFLLSEKLIKGLNRAGLANLQISIDALNPDPSEFVQKTLRSLRPKLERLERLAEFDVHVTVVLCPESREEFPTLIAELERFPFFISINLVHDDKGAVMIEGSEYEALWDRHFREGRAFSYLEEDYGRALLQGRRPRWHCRAGGRFLYVDEFGKAQFCSAQRGRLDRPVEELTSEDLRHYARTPKGCEDGCAIFCVYRDSQLDGDPLLVVRSLAKAARRGVLFGKPKVAPPLPSPAAPPAPEPEPARRRLAVVD